MNIIIYNKFPFIATNGGMERISVVLGDWLATKGNTIYYLSDIFDKKSPIFMKDEVGLADEDNFQALRSFIKDKKIDIILNQATFLPCCDRLFDLKVDVKIISVLHQSLDGMFAHPPIPFLSWNNKVRWSRTWIFETFFRLFFYNRYHSHLRKVVKGSDKLVVLSEKYKKETQRYACKTNNIVAIGNPLTLPICDETLEKENNIVFLGRLSWQKNPLLLLSIWKHISNISKEWKLYILGDGIYRKEMELFIEKENLENVYLEGKQDPISYLKRSKVLCLTSMYEAYPLVLHEAMNYGVVPVVFNTFASVDEIISDGIDGCIIEPFDKEKYINAIELIMNDTAKYNYFSQNARNKAKNNTVDFIGQQWIKLLNSL